MTTTLNELSWRCGRTDAVPMRIMSANVGLGRTDLTYEIRPLPAGWNAQDIVGGINFCLGAVSAVTPIRFTQVTQNADLTFSFTGMLPVQPGDPPEPMPPWATGYTRDGVITYQPGSTYSAQLPTPAGAVDFIAITLHELGHFLGILGHSTDPAAAMYYSAPTGIRRFAPDDIEQLQLMYGGRVDQVPGWFGASTAGVDVAAFTGASGTNLVVAHVDDPDGANQAYYRVGWGLDDTGVPTAGWSQIVKMGGPIGHSTNGLGIAVGQVTGGPGLDLVMVWMDTPDGENQAFYRIGRDIDGSGMNATWGPDIAIPGWHGHDTDGLAAALGDIDADGKPEMVVAWIDDPDGENTIHLRIGRGFDVAGVVQNWSGNIPVPGHVGANSSGLGVALTDLRGNGRPDLVLFWVDDRDGENRGFVRIGWDLDETGTPIGGWSGELPMAGWWGANTVDGGAAVAGVRGFARPDLVAVNLDDRDDDDRAHYRVLSPPLPAWQWVGPVAPPRNGVAPNPVDRLAAVAPLPNSPPTPQLDELADVILVAMGVDRGADRPQEVIGAFWDKTDLDEDAGSDILDFVTDRVDSPSRRIRSPLAAVARIPTRVDLFWIDTANRVETSMAPVGMPQSTQAPTWNAPKPLIPGPTARAAVGTVPGSPLAAASIDDKHVAFVVAGPADQLSAQHWVDGTGWGAQSDLVGSWPRPVYAIAAITRQHKFMEVFWLDGEGAVWAASTSRTGVWKRAERIHRPGSARLDSPLAAVTRGDEQVDLFWIEPGGGVVTSSFHDARPSNTPDGDGWANPFPIDGGRPAATGSGLAAVHGGEQRLHAFWEGTGEASGALMTAWAGTRPDGTPTFWSPPVQVTEVRAMLRGTDIAAAARAPGHVRVFFVDRFRTAVQTWWGTLP